MTDTNEEPEEKTKGEQSNEIIEKTVDEIFEQGLEALKSLVQDDQEKPIAEEE